MEVTNQATNSTPFEAMNENNAIENDREFKAHIYQQLTDLQPFLSGESQVAVMVQEEESSDEDPESTEHKEFALTLVATFGEYRVETEGKDENLYEAFNKAKFQMLEQLEEWYNSAVDTSDRDAQIQSVIEGNYTIH